MYSSDLATRVKEEFALAFPGVCLYFFPLLLFCPSYSTVESPLELTITVSVVIWIWCLESCLIL